MADPDEGAPQPQKPVVIQSTIPNNENFPDLTKVQSTTLRNSPRVRKVASYTVIRDRNTGDIHHDAITIKTWKKTAKICKEEPDHTVTLSSEDDDEIQTLLTFITAVRAGAQIDGKGKYLVLGAGDIPNSDDLQRLLTRVSAGDQAQAFATVLERATTDQPVFQALMERAARDPHLFAESAAALNLAAYKSAVVSLSALIEKPGVKEQEFQSLLVKYPWVFGSEYSELLSRRTFTRDAKQDFVMRRTVDGYIELIEIKTPLSGATLFNLDQSHGSYYASAELSKVLGQVQNYIVQLDADRHTIRSKDGEDTHRIRAKVIIGRDCNEDQTAALRTLNGHLHRIEVLTFDQLLRIARRVISYLETSLKRHAQNW